MIEDEKGDDDVSGVGGYDNDVDISSDPSAVCGRFVRALVARWPSLYVDLVDDDTSQCQRIESPWQKNIQLPRHGVLFIYRDAAMEKFTEEHGGIPMLDGEGTLALWFRPLDPPTSGYKLDLVTPAMPEHNDFSKWALSVLLQATEAS